MRILLDHNVPHPLRWQFRDEDEIYTARYMGWDTLKNGDLLEAAQKAAFGVLVTVDKEIQPPDADGPAIIILVRCPIVWMT